MIYAIKLNDSLDDRDCDVIIDAIEEAGMLPPDRMSSALSLTTKEWKIEKQQEFLSDHSWEPE